MSASNAANVERKRAQFFFNYIFSQRINALIKGQMCVD